MKKTILKIKSLLLLFLFTASCANNSEVKEEKQLTNLVVSNSHMKKTDLMHEWLVSEAFKTLPERKCLRYCSFEDSINVTVILTDTCTNRTNIMYTTLSGSETVSFDRKYSNGKTLLLVFSYESGELSVHGSKILSQMDTTVLDEVAVEKIIDSKFKI